MLPLLLLLKALLGPSQLLLLEAFLELEAPLSTGSYLCASLRGDLGSRVRLSGPPNLNQPVRGCIESELAQQ